MTASTGIAACQHPFGQTIHSFTGIGDGRYTDNEVIKNLRTDVKRKIEETHVLIIDEISMISVKIFMQVTINCLFNFYKTIPQSKYILEMIVQWLTCMIWTPKIVQ